MHTTAPGCSLFSLLESQFDTVHPRPASQFLISPKKLEATIQHFEFLKAGEWCFVSYLSFYIPVCLMS